jgi:hypothetical protein
MPLENSYEPILPRGRFFIRVARWAATAAILVFGSLALGMCGYHYLEKLPWIESLLDASMILGGMGPVDPIKTSAGKLFASFYALHSGLAIVGIAGLLFAPIVHRFLHKFHIEQSKPADQDDAGEDEN